MAREMCPVLTGLLEANVRPPISDDGGSQEPAVIARDHEYSDCPHRCVNGYLRERTDV